MSLFSLEGQVAVVTGGNSGIGLKTVERFLQAGAQVVVADLADAPSHPTGDNVRYIRCDVAQEQQVRDALSFAVTEFGGLDILVNNAGVFSGYGKLIDKDTSDFARCFKLNVLGVSYGIKYAADLMADGGRIINTSSAAGLIGAAGIGDYSASKHAVVGLTKSAALELGERHIRVNCICPTTVNTPMADEEGGEHMLAAEKILVPLGRICEPEEVAALIHFLASNDCNFVNGQAIAIDGGMSAGGSEKLYETLIDQADQKDV
jgi:NAD(P)-dependent dehydrogenase (short-subunit alcohol dehydrogenase family)